MQSAVKTVMTSLPGRIVSYDAATKLAVVEPTVHTGNPLPPIPDVPVKFPRGGGYRMVWPLNKGDEVTLHFHKWDPSRFRVSGENSAANVYRDAGVYPIAIPGSESESAASYNGGGSGLHLGNDAGTVEIVVTPTQIKLGASAAASGVAKGDVVDANFNAIASFLASHVHPTPAGPSSPPGPTPVAPTMNATASTKVFTQ
jgi:hypothetical protein